MPRSESRSASSQAAWALLIEAAASARLDAHRLTHLTNRAQKLIEESPHKDHFHQVAGDIITAAPKRLESLKTHLDRLSLALARMGTDFLESRLSIGDKTLVDEAVEPALGRSVGRYSAVQRVAHRYLEEN